MNKSFINKFNNKKIMFIVPHEDDEINLGGTFIYTLTQNSSADVYVIFLTNGDYRGKEMGLIRLNEALNSCHTLGVENENVIFMGYPDIGAGDENNIFSFEDGFSFNGNMKETYALENHPEYHFIKHSSHASYGMKNMRADLEELILDYKPDFIFYNDNDYHPIHRIESMTMDYVLNKICSENTAYIPEIYKGLSYDLSWLAPSDFKVYNLESSKTVSTIENKTGQYLLSNPYVSLDELIRFPVYSKITDGLIIDNPVFKAGRYHKTQLAAYLADRYINSDICFYRKRFDNMIGKTASINTTQDVSDNDLQNICNGQTWYTDKPWIKQGEYIDYDINAVNLGSYFEIILEKESQCDLFIYKALKSNVDNLQITICDSVYDIYSCNGVFSLKNISAKDTIKISVPSNEKLLVNEIDLFEVENDKRPWFVKLMVDNEFAYTYYTNSKEPNISTIIYSTSGDIISNTEEVIIEKTKNGVIKAFLKNHPEIYDIIKINKLTLFTKIKFKYLTIKNNFMFRYLRDIDVGNNISIVSKTKLLVKCILGK